MGEFLSRPGLVEEVRQSESRHRRTEDLRLARLFVVDPLVRQDLVLCRPENLLSSSSDRATTITGGVLCAVLDGPALTIHMDSDVLSVASATLDH